MVAVVSGEVVAEGAGGPDGGEVLQPEQGGAGVCHKRHDQLGHYSTQQLFQLCNNMT